jgi:hypothetical protein
MEYITSHPKVYQADPTSLVSASSLHDIIVIADICSHR